MIEKLAKFCKAQRGRRIALAKLCGVHRGDVTKWIGKVRGIPPKYTETIKAFLKSK